MRRLLGDRDIPRKARADPCADKRSFLCSAHGLRVRWLPALRTTLLSAARQPGPSSPRTDHPRPYTRKTNRHKTDVYFRRLRNIVSPCKSGTCQFSSLMRLIFYVKHGTFSALCSSFGAGVSNYNKWWPFSQSIKKILSIVEFQFLSLFLSSQTA